MVHCLTCEATKGSVQVTPGCLPPGEGGSVGFRIFLPPKADESPRAVCGMALEATIETVTVEAEATRFDGPSTGPVLRAVL